MCFSAAASFAASASLGTLGAVGIKKNRDKRAMPLAFMPVIFAVQQALEGVIWVTLRTPLVSLIATKLYLFFAYAFWPAFVPWAVYRVEPSPERRKWMLPLVIGGWCVGAYGFLVIAFFATPVAAFCSSLNYAVPVNNPWYGYFYVAAGCLTCLLSSSKWIVAFGFALFGSLILAFTFWMNTGASVWCFFGAVLSALIYFYIRSQARPSAQTKK